MSPRKSVDRDAATQRLIRDATEFHQRGWMLGTSGNLSIATGEDRFLVTASGRHKGRLGTSDFVEVRIADVAPTEPDDPKPSAETWIHAEVYQRTSAGAVYHVHQPLAAVLSTIHERARFIVIDGVEMLKGIGLRSSDTLHLPIVGNDQDIPALAGEIGTWIRDGLEAPGIMIHRHGIYTWGEDAEAAYRHIEIFGYLFEYAYALHRA